MIEQLKEIGDGAYGIVYSGMIEEKEYALKRNLIDRPIDFIGSIRELDILLRLPHPNIVQLKKVLYHNPFKHIKIKNNDYDTKDDIMHFAFEKGLYDLHKLIYRYSSSFEFLRVVCADILLGLEFAHSREIIHRDIKPSNILIFKEKDETTGNSVYRSKICDFGLSKPFTYQGKQSPKVVTSCYRPPEILMDQEYNKKIDIWSVGCVFFESFSKQRFSDSNHEKDIKEDISKMLKKDERNIPYYWTLIPKKYPESFKDLLSHMLDPSQETRFDATEALNHKFFDGVRSYIQQVRTKHPLRPPNNNVFKYHDCKDRSMAGDFFSEAIKKYVKEDWYRHRTFFLAIDLFDRWLLWVNQNGSSKSHSKEHIEFYCLICLYMSIKYFACISDIPSFSEIAGKKYSTAEYKKLALTFEKNMIKNVLHYCIYRRTIYEAADTKDRRLENEDVQKILTVVLFEPERIKNKKIYDIVGFILEDENK